MAESAMGGLFQTPEMYQQARLQQQQEEAARYAQMDPMQRATYGTYMAGQQLGSGIGQLFGVQDPQLRMISQRNALARQIDPNDPNSYMTVANLAAQGGDPQFAMSLAAAGQTALKDLASRRASFATAQKAELATQQEMELRAALSKLGPGATSEQILGVVAQYGSPDKVLAVLQGSADKAENRAARVLEQEANRQQQIQLQQDRIDAQIAAAAAAGATQKQIAQMNIDSRIAMQQFMASLRADEKATKPLPSYLAKGEDDDYATAKAATNLASDANNFIGRITSGEIKFGLKDKASIRARQVFGSSDPDVIAREDYDKFLKILTNESLRLNKGTQTEGDAVRAAKELDSSESPEAAAAAMRRLVEINVRRVQNASDDVSRRRTNANFPAPQEKINVPKFDIQILNNEEYNRFVNNPKYPSGTPFVDPKGIRRTKP
jgi:alkylhydroperoxidase/carboxymuconolactone decarboxylase family protein YurZ